MEIEADDVLPRLLAALGIEDCVLVGHSDGGTIALNYAASDPEPLRAVVTLAAHAINEPVCVAAIRRPARPSPRAICASACRNITATMSTAPSTCGRTPGWRRASSRWTPTAGCPASMVPVQAIQGEDDDYGSELQLGIIAGKVGGYCETRLVPDCGHSPHLQQPAYVLSEITRFVAPLALMAELRGSRYQRKSLMPLRAAESRFSSLDAAQLSSDTVGQRAWASWSWSRARCLSPRRMASMPMKNAAGHLPLAFLAVSSDSAATSSSPAGIWPSRNLAIGPGHS